MDLTIFIIAVVASMIFVLIAVIGWEKTKATCFLALAVAAGLCLITSSIALGSSMRIQENSVVDNSDIAMFVEEYGVTLTDAQLEDIAEYVDAREDEDASIGTTLMLSESGKFEPVEIIIRGDGTGNIEGLSLLTRADNENLSELKSISDIYDTDDASKEIENINDSSDVSRPTPV